MTLNKLISKIAGKIDPPEPARSKVANWVRSLTGALVWDPWDFPEPTEEEAAATLERLRRQLELTAERLPPDRAPPTPEQVEATRRILDDVVAKYEAEKAAVRAFTAKIERERAERGRTENPASDRT
jgi:hypothetical protein